MLCELIQAVVYTVTVTKLSVKHTVRNCIYLSQVELFGDLNRMPLFESLICSLSSNEVFKLEKQTRTPSLLEFPIPPFHSTRTLSRQLKTVQIKLVIKGVSFIKAVSNNGIKVQVAMEIKRWNLLEIKGHAKRILHG